MPLCPNLFPTSPSNKKIALVGEAPGADEEKSGQPFCGVSGQFLTRLLSRAGVSRGECFFGNISQHRPPNNEIAAFEWNGAQIQHGLESLAHDIERLNPNIIVLLGNTALKAAKDPTTTHPLNPKAFHFRNAQWRGSLFSGDERGPFAGKKCMASYHPTYCLRDYEATPLLQFDLRKAVAQSENATLVLPQRTLTFYEDPNQLLQRLNDLLKVRTPVALDIEGYIDAMSCISFAVCPTDAFIVPFFRKDGSSIYPRPAELLIWRALTAVLESPYVPKVLQNSLYDRFVLHYSYGIRVRNVVDDTMLHHWELYSELEKSLSVQTSLYTDEPYYKGDRKTQDDRTFYDYCCRDSAVTLEINNKLNGYLSNSSLGHYKLNVALLNPMLYMELRGISYNVEAAKQRRTLLQQQLYSAQAKLNGLAGHGFDCRSGVSAIKERVRQLMWTKKGDRIYKQYEEAHKRFQQVLLQPPTLAALGELEDLCEVSLNTSSNKQFIPFLYETLKLPVQTNTEKGQDPKPTADYEALLRLSREILKQDENDPRLAIIRLAIEIRALGTRQQMLSISADRDNRIRCGYNIVGSNTGRVTCYESPTGSGYNLQTIPNYTNTKEAPGGVLGDRDLFLSDEGYWFFQCDLSGADGWTVAAYSAMLGDPTMLEDYRAGVSPFKILTLLARGLPISKDRLELAQQVKVIGKDDWDRFANKRVQHGAAYLEGGLTISRNILTDSEGKLYMTPSECDKLKAFFFQRYWGIRKWHDYIARRIRERPILTAASGQVRQFFGRPDEILTKAVAFEPQANTTFATNLAMYKLWTDPENRIYETQEHLHPSSGQAEQGKVRLRIEPLHQVHDALCGQFLRNDTAWASSKIKTWFLNPLQIAGQSITIPYEGGYGPSWGSLNEGKL